jgi:hypothetical protein
VYWDVFFPNVGHLRVARLYDAGGKAIRPEPREKRKKGKNEGVIKSTGGKM